MGEEVGDALVEFGQRWGSRPQRAHLPLQDAQPVQGAGGADLGGGAHGVPAVSGGLFQVAAEEMLGRKRS
ncbi:MAG: hypothetical protein ACRDTG_21135 [Pseudonocardiaceae bacterium]